MNTLPSLYDVQDDVLQCRKSRHWYSAFASPAHSQHVNGRGHGTAQRYQPSPGDIIYPPVNPSSWFLQAPPRRKITSLMGTADTSSVYKYSIGSVVMNVIRQASCAWRKLSF